MKETEQTLLDQIKNDVAKEHSIESWRVIQSHATEDRLNDFYWPIVCERYTTAKAKAEPPTQEQLQKIETEYQNRIMNTLMDKWGLSVQNARDIGRDLFYTYVFPVYELGGQFGFKAGYTRSQVQASCEATLKKASENAKMLTFHKSNGDVFEKHLISSPHASEFLRTAIDKSSITDPKNIKIL